MNIIKSDMRTRLRYGRRSGLGALALAIAVAFGTASGSALAQEAAVHVHISAQPLGKALLQLGEQTSLQIFYAQDVVKGIPAPAVSGNVTPEHALQMLLRGTPITYKRTGNNITLTRNSADTVTELPVVKVVGARDAAQRYNPPTTVGSKIPLTQREIPNTVDVVTQERIQQQNFQSLDQALKAAPGVYVYQSDADRVQYYSRGYPISAMQIDGVPVAISDNMSNTGSSNSPGLAMYDRVEVLDGPAGLYNGFGNTGGVLNLVRKHAPSEFEGTATLGAGTNDNYLGTLDVGGPLNKGGTLRGRFVTSGQTQHLNQDGTWRHDQMFYGTLEADVAPDTLLRVGASYMQRDSNIGWANKTPIYPDGTPIAGRSRFFGSPWNHDKYAYTDIFATLEHKLDNGWKVSVNGDYAYNAGDIYTGTVNTTVDPSTHTASYGTTNKKMRESDTSFDVNVSGPYSLFGRPAQATIGFNYGHISDDVTTYYGPKDYFNTQTVNVFDIVYPKQYFDPTHTQKTNLTSEQYGVYGNTRIKILDPLALIIGGRATWWSYESTPDPLYNYLNSKKSSESYNGKFTPYVGLVYDINKTYSAYVSYSKIFQPQYYTQQSGAALDPIQGQQYEVGLKGSYLGGRLNTSLALFWMEEKNRAMPDPNDPTSGYYLAEGRARTRGVDLRASGEILPGWTVYAGYTYNDSKLLDDSSFDGTASGFSQIAPMHLFKLWTNYRLPGKLNKWEVGGGVNATSKLYYKSAAYTITQGGYYTADARVAYHISPLLTVNLNVSNLFNRSYYQPIYNGVVYSPGRQAMLTLQAKF